MQFLGLGLSLSKPKIIRMLVGGVKCQTKKNASVVQTVTAKPPKVKAAATAKKLKPGGGNSPHLKLS